MTDTVGHTPLPELPLSYRPHKYDDWGTIRDARGLPVLRARTFTDELTKDAHRQAGTDPDEDWGRRVVTAVNSHAALLEMVAKFKAGAEAFVGYQEAMADGDDIEAMLAYALAADLLTAALKTEGEMG